MKKQKLLKVLANICSRTKDLRASKLLKISANEKLTSKIRGVNRKFANIFRNYALREGLVVNERVDLTKPDAWLEPDIFAVPVGSTKERIIEAGKKAFLKAIAGYLSGVFTEALHGKFTENKVEVDIPAQGRGYDSKGSSQLSGRRRIHVKLGEPHGIILIGTVDFVPNLAAKGGEGNVSFNLLDIPSFSMKFSEFGDIEHGWSISESQQKKILDEIQKAVDNYLKNHKKLAIPSLDY